MNNRTRVWALEVLAVVIGIPTCLDQRWLIQFRAIQLLCSNLDNLYLNILLTNLKLMHGIQIVIYNKANR